MFELYLSGEYSKNMYSEVVIEHEEEVTVNNVLTRNTPIPLRTSLISV